jgi:hypothetical protein
MLGSGPEILSLAGIQLAGGTVDRPNLRQKSGTIHWTMVSGRLEIAIHNLQDRYRRPHQYLGIGGQP